MSSNDNKVTMDKRNSDLMMYFWVRQDVDMFEFLTIIENAMFDSAEKREKLFEVITTESLPERIYLCLN